AIDERQMAAVGSKLERQRRADATSGAGHDGDCVSERKPHRALPFDRGCKLATPLRRCRSPAIRVWAVGSGCRVLYAHGMSEEYLIIVVRMAVALLIGALIGAHVSRPTGRVPHPRAGEPGVGHPHAYDGLSGPMDDRGFARYHSHRPDPAGAG